MYPSDPTAFCIVDVDPLHREMYYCVKFRDQEKDILVEAYDSTPIYRVGDKPRRNPVPFTPTQIAAIRSGMEEGLTLVSALPFLTSIRFFVESLLLHAKESFFYGLNFGKKKQTTKSLC